MLRHALTHIRERPRLLRRESRDDRLRRRARVRRLTCQHFVCQRTERIDVGARIDHAVARCLFRRHVLRRAERQPRLRHALPARLAHRQRDPEVGHHRLPMLKEDVLRLQVAMDDAVLMRIVERARNRDGDAYRLVNGELTLAVEPVPQRLALDVRHHIVQESVGSPRIEQREEIGMLEVRRNADLAQEPLGAEHRAEVGAQKLERDVPVVSEVASEIHRRHATATELALDLVATGERGLKVVDRGVAHRARDRSVV